MVGARTRTATSLDAEEVARFDRLAQRWWDPDGPMRPLHRFNPARVAIFRDAICARYGRDGTAMRPLDGLTVLDVGCGAGVLAEPLARLGAAVTGVDPASELIGVAQAHADETGLDIDYRSGAAEDLAAEGKSFDVVVASEVVEHVADVDAFVATIGGLVKPGGVALFSTINRTLMAHALVIVGAEYMLRWLPVGTHSYEKFVTPAELRIAARAAGLEVTDQRGIRFAPLKNVWEPCEDMTVNYALAAAKAGAD